MSVIDAAFVDAGAGGAEFAAPSRSRRHALAALLYVTAVAVFSYRTHGDSYVRAEDSVALVLPAAFWMVAFVLWGTRQGRLRVDSSGVRWGFSWMGFRMPTDRLVEVMVYDDAVALRSRGSPTPWTLLRRDWDRWPELVRAMLRLDATRTQHARGAPFFYRIQGYGRALDLLLVLNSLAATFFVLARR